MHDFNRNSKRMDGSMTDIIITPGFARVDQDGNFQYAPDGVFSFNYVLLLADKDTYTYPTEGGWNWYETEADARTALNAPILSDTE